ncbi:MAG: exonuclease domain-containing protein [Tepidisphaeraceae bacterium]|jgi:DNA polymerase-3 subunit epsilon
MPFSLLQSVGSTPVACLDVETTGASSDLGDRIVEVGIIRFEGGRVACEYQQLINPGRRIAPGASALTGITDEMVRGQPRFAEEWPRISVILSGAVLLGHNIPFDLSFLAREVAVAGESLEEICALPVLDTVRIARRRFGRGGNGLGRLARRLGYEPPIAHRALPDARTTGIIFERLLEPLGGWNLPMCDCLIQQGGPVGWPSASAERVNPLPIELEESLESGRPVMMEYLDAQERLTQRVIEPLHVRQFAGELILVAHCRLRNDRRNFKIQRIVRLTRIESSQV